MTTATLGTSGAVDSALRRAFSEASVRLQPTTRITDILTALTAMGITAEVQDGILVLSQGTTTFNTGLALRKFATQPEHAAFFILETDDPKTWTNATKIDFIKKNGSEAWGKKVSAPVIEAGIRVLDPNMSRADYQKLTRAEKVQFIGEYGDKAVAQVMGR